MTVNGYGTYTANRSLTGISYGTTLTWSAVAKNGYFMDSSSGSVSVTSNTSISPTASVPIPPYFTNVELRVSSSGVDLYFTGNKGYMYDATIGYFDVTMMVNNKETSYGREIDTNSLYPYVNDIVIHHIFGGKGCSNVVVDLEIYNTSYVSSSMVGTHRLTGG